MKKMLSLLLALIMCMSLCVPAFASEPRENVIAPTIICTNTQEQRDRAFTEYMKAITDQLTRDNLGESKTVLGTISRRTVTGEPSGQPRDGFSFPSGGAVYFTRKGGPSIGVSVSVGIPGFGSMGVSIPLGGYTEDTSGVAVWYKPSPNFYRVQFTKEVEIQPWVAYWRQTSLDAWEVAGSGTYVNDISIQPTLIFVK